MAEDAPSITPAADEDSSAAKPLVQHPPLNGRTPVCFVVDEESSIRHFVSLIMQGSGIDTEEFADGPAFREALNRRMPDLLFLDVPLDTADAITSLGTLGNLKCGCAVTLMSTRGSAVLENVKGIGEKHALRMIPVLKKPFDIATVQRIIHDLKIGTPPPVAARIGLDEALRNNWMEFWYQPKIDLRKKQLAGVEAFARARHPQHGILSPSAFMPGADEASVMALSEKGLIAALEASHSFSELGVNLRIAFNLPVTAVTKLDIPAIVRAHRRDTDKWPGLIIDIPEDQIITDITLAIDIARKLESVNIKLAIDDFGRGYTSLMRHKMLPFAEMKLAQTFVSDCGTDKVNAPICKTVIDLAHNFGSIAIGIGVKRASDALALVAMGCDYGQGFLFGQPMPQERFMSLLRQRASTRQQQVAGNIKNAVPVPQQA
ncbi:MAG: EAL domain-containing response regulator [Rhizobiales bacterium]|nr:EAL domain-containing response regulator [Hyphomicrobiales bacterium]